MQNGIDMGVLTVCSLSIIWNHTNGRVLNDEPIHTQFRSTKYEVTATFSDEWRELIMK